MEIEQLLKIIIVLLGLLAGWEIKTRLMRRNLKLDLGLKSGALEFVMVTEEADTIITKKSVVRYQDSRYTFQIYLIEIENEELILEERFDTRALLEKFMVEHTNFRLSDFIRK